MRLPDIMFNMGIKISNPWPFAVALQSETELAGQARKQHAQ